ncbi:4'-phosphopantetheinyl transferase family protein [Paractinoplanes brasiliensis]|uniref:4'-phosphopantetheinyl transferase EntD n=1 Tax=Paractinoplanes brasiliensis TaxID=52695 RepID=A0A4R6JBY7_9ACTN|nr:4'-phosphopantetheinyl transferase superfamily protein [Actinoplanes brasiliensis]TDO32817.1 4'-phosphopantetheinyl transferase EntD [Actinoplanes brasiliensis]GID31638.1 4'-phosphopantetheinyl transferase [Actinoplanes brasiliensis]
MIEEILPPGVESVDTFTDPPGATLLGEEVAIVEPMVEKRRREFTTGRWAAREAMARLGRPPVPLPRGPRGEPLWPAGLIGSITHCPGYRAAAVAEAGRMALLGIDAEPDEPMPGDVFATVSLPAERERVATLHRDHPGVSWERLLFSAKESVYKTWFPLMRRWLDFEEADVTIDPVGGTFRARLLVAGPRLHGRELTGFTGRWLARKGLLLTAIAGGAKPPPSRVS